MMSKYLPFMIDNFKVVEEFFLGACLERGFSGITRLFLRYYPHVGDKTVRLSTTAESYSIFIFRLFILDLDY